MPSKDKKSRKQHVKKSGRRSSKRKTPTMKMINDLSQKVDILLRNVETKLEIDSTIQLGGRLITISQTNITPLRYTFKIDDFEEIVVENEGNGFVMKSSEDIEDSDEETPSISSELSEDISETSEPSEEESTNTSSEGNTTEATSEPSEEDKIEEDTSEPSEEDKEDKEDKEDEDKEDEDKEDKEESKESDDL